MNIVNAGGKLISDKMIGRKDIGGKTPGGGNEGATLRINRATGSDISFTIPREVSQLSDPLIMSGFTHLANYLISRYGNFNSSPLSPEEYEFMRTARRDLVNFAEVCRKQGADDWNEYITTSMVSYIDLMVCTSVSGTVPDEKNPESETADLITKIGNWFRKL